MDWFDDFDDEYDAEMEMEDQLDGDSECDAKPNKAESQGDDLTAKDEPCDDKLTAYEAAILGGAMGFAYEQGLIERKRRKRKRVSDDDSD